jgi:tetratricopeptide (TPR) repeat protein
MLTRFRGNLVAGLLVAIVSAPAWACLWDSDTLQMERQRFPGALEIITGKFVRHSRAYYEWRIGDRQKKLVKKPGDPALIDDLAVAYAKLGRPEEGIPLLEQVLASHPDRYETLANLGTLLFFAGKLEASKTYIQRAIELNPDAHFGRERYQLLLTEYVLQGESESQGVMSGHDRIPLYPPVGFARYVLQSKFGKASENTGGNSKMLPQHKEELERATKGVLGMMHFADHQSPILLEALGDLLVTGAMEENSSQLAGRAYLRAAQFSKGRDAQEDFRKMADSAIADQIAFEFHKSGNPPLQILESQVAKEVAAADAWFGTIEAREKEWIADGGDVDRQFAEEHYVSLDSTIAVAKKQLQSESQRHFRLWLTSASLLVAVPLAMVVVAITGIYWLRKRRRPRME